MQDTGVLVYCMRSFAALQGSKVPDRKPRDRVLLLAGDTVTFLAPEKVFFCVCCAKIKYFN